MTSPARPPRSRAPAPAKAARPGTTEAVPYAAFLRGVMPANCKMSALVACFERAGFAEVSTVLGSGNVVFRARPAEEAALQARIEAAMQLALGRVFGTFVRSIEHLQGLLAADPFANARLPPDAKRVVTFLRRAPERGAPLPPARDGARIVGHRNREAFSAYVPSPKGPVFMKLLAETFGDDVTTRTWETLERVVAKAERNR
jgi:uncharacterized protein (DUF1697 family)